MRYRGAAPGICFGVAVTRVLGLAVPVVSAWPGGGLKSAL
ncbi:hypothetical protein HMPREF0388_0603 [Mobiluncus curtisii ATCC 51333]|uniref:Uncharacterized protein n=1 Tax=Mobiluncus curtisii ATCC 51333 TaxID=887326 RepID=E6LXL6_9ACTO|nr:hypothetical protein HMPREF0388_0603 [Mobiluncus curtisii ATCC 51333]